MNIAQFFENTAGKYPNKQFVIQEVDAKIARTISYKEFYEKVQTAGVYLMREGVRKGDRVAIVLPHSPETLIMWFAVCGIGGVAAILEPVLTQEEIQKQIAHLEPKLIVSEANIARFLGPDHGGRFSFYPSVPEDWAGIVYSSGTTGAPKGVMQSHGNYVMTGEGFACWFALGPDDRLYTCLSLAHINAQAYSVMGAIACGGTLILGSKFNRGNNFWNKIVATGATHINMIGGMLRDLHRGHGGSEQRLHKVRTIANGQAIPNAHIHRYLETAFACRIIPTYGASENTFGFVLPLDADVYGENCVGKRKLHPAIPESEFQTMIVDENGSPLTAPSTVGELLLKNPFKAGYWKDDTRTAEKWQDGWYRTGDLFSFDANGFAYFQGRKDDIIRRGGNLVNPAEVEAVLLEHHAVSCAAVVGVKDNFGEASIKAVVVLKEQFVGRVGEETLRVHCAAKLASYKIPQLWEFRTSLPENASGRVQKKLL